MVLDHRGIFYYNRSQNIKFGHIFVFYANPVTGGDLVSLQMTRVLVNVGDLIMEAEE